MPKYKEIAIALKKKSWKASIKKASCCQIKKR